MKIKELFDTEEKWTTGTWARNRFGESIGEFCFDARCWCLSGAVNRCYNGINYFCTIQRIKNYIDEKYKMTSIIGWNDRIATFKDIRELVETLDI